MRKGEIKIGGLTYPVAGLSVSQSLNEDTRLNKDTAAATPRMRRVALALQNAGAFLPDPLGPKDAEGKSLGQFKASERSVEDVVKVLDGDLFTDMSEWYAAELE